MSKRKELINQIVKIGILSALSSILYFIKFHVPIFPSFLEVHFSMLPALLGALALGPRDGALIILIRFLVKITISETYFIGEIADLIIGLSCVIPAGYFYQFHRNKKGGVKALIMAWALWIIVGTLSNLFTVPSYMAVLHMDKQAIVKFMGVVPFINESNYLGTYLLFGALPFNAMLASSVCLVTFFVYKSVSRIFKHDFFGKKKRKTQTKVMVMVDSFKGTMTSITAGTIIKEELELKGLTVDMSPISDGGEGFLDVIKVNQKLDYLSVDVHDAIGRMHKARYLYDINKKTAYVELAECCGIAKLKKDELAPYDASTYGLGEQIKYIIEKHKPNKIVIGIGGSASSDAGSGMIEALGGKFYDEHEDEIKMMNNRKLHDVTRIHVGNVRTLFNGIEVDVLTDVKNPLLGQSGAVYVFGPQKGAKIEDLEVMENNVSHFKKIVEEQLFGNYSNNEEGEGAAGGVGFAFNRIIRANIMSGSNVILKLIDFERICKEYDIVITGEGKFDSQTLNGKIIKGIMENKPKRLIIVAGIVDDDVKMDDVYSIVPNICSSSESMAHPEENLRKLVQTLKL